MDKHHSERYFVQQALNTRFHLLKDFYRKEDTMKWEKIVEGFKDEWVLIDVKEVDEDFNLKNGDVIAHSKDKEEIYKKLLEIRPRSFSIEYTGKIPEDLAVVLCHENIQA